MVWGGALSGGTSRSNSASTNRCCRPRYSRRSMPSGLIGAERFGGDFAVLADQHFDTSLGFFQLLPAGFAESDSALEKLDGTLQREVAAFELFDHFLEFI